MNHEAIRIIRDEHAGLAAVLRSLLAMLKDGPQDAPLRYFDVMRAMLFYIDEYPERLHHPKESDLLFPRLARARPDLLPLVERLEGDHLRGEARVRELQHLLLAWELNGESRRAAFAERATEYAHFYLEHMKAEEQFLLPAAEAALTDEEWGELDAAFGQNHDPLAGGDSAALDRLFTRIVRSAPSPIGLGPALGRTAAGEGRPA
ncbi:hemerythrin domain-containing protein [Ramlibacter sp. Leaf400]|uniref:hemerythrin domain-containing protein n=1 Tax=Ramlibacter sp. Leaf400 TaxID=1736365 RepID=UPI0006FA316A|nr:hemerythrin domain-containing protein [Ramlibacter sp. Leaf400]KQT10836.1 hemerythrin [Ramlibacter sp. Leaf400]